MQILLIYLAAISLIAVIITVSDKQRAVRHRWRIRESRLLLVGALGGSAAMFLTMLLIRHKTRRVKFMLGLPAMMLAQAAAVFLIWRAFNG